MFFKMYKSNNSRYVILNTRSSRQGFMMLFSIWDYRWWCVFEEASNTDKPGVHDRPWTGSQNLQIPDCH